MIKIRWKRKVVSFLKFVHCLQCQYSPMILHDSHGYTSNAIWVFLCDSDFCFWETISTLKTPSFEKYILEMTWVPHIYCKTKETLCHVHRLILKFIADNFHCVCSILSNTNNTSENVLQLSTQRNFDLNNTSFVYTQSSVYNNIFSVIIF